jgi:anti-sigma factor RsiW
MQNPLRRITLLFPEGVRRHPASATLVAYVHGELPPSVRARVSRHLQHCKCCEKEALAIDDDLLYFKRLMAVVETSAAMEDGLSRLEQCFESRIAEAPVPILPKPETRLTSALLKSIQNELMTYVGSRAAERILARADRSFCTPQNLSKQIELTMGGFIGSRAAAAVARRVDALCGAMVSHQGIP